MPWRLTLRRRWRRSGPTASSLLPLHVTPRDGNRPAGRAYLSETSTCRYPEVMREILFADDDEAVRDMVSSLLHSAGFRFRLARSGAEALTAVRADPPDLVLLDYRMGNPDGFEVCRAIKSDPRLEHLPVLILTGQGALDDRLEGFDAGADDYLGKPFDNRELLARISALLRLAELGRDRNPTSGLAGGEAIHRELERCRERGAPFTICYFDIDNFKPFGDRFGFAVGDGAIRAVGELLRDVAHSRDAFAGHVGGDDFILLLSDGHARNVVQQVQTGFRGRIKRLLPTETVTSGCYHGIGRDEVEREHPLPRLSAAILHLDPTLEIPLARLGEEVARVKQRAKAERVSGIAETNLLAASPL